MKFRNIFVSIVIATTMIISAQIALPTFQAVHKPQSTSSSSLFVFTSHTFTNCGATGREGPTLANCKSSYDVSWEDDTDLFNVQTQGFQEWTVPTDDNYTIEVWGAGGGSTNYGAQGGGTKIKGNFDLIENHVLKIIVGQLGTSSTTSSGGGGGGTIVYNITTGSLLIAAGGGGGAGGWRNTTTNPEYQDGANASSETAGVDGQPQGPGSWAYSTGSGGTNGDGGTAAASHRPGGGGGGFSSDGGEYTVGYGGGSYGRKGLGFSNGYIGGRGESNNDSYAGGFGGGGGGALGGGGGGGYSGGGGGPWTGYSAADNGHGGGGGGSYNSGSNQFDSSTLGYNTDHGKAIITKN